MALRLRVMQKIIHSAEDGRAVVQYLKEHAAQAVHAGTPLQVTVAPYKHKRSGEQNRLMWLLLGQVSQQAVADRRRYDPDIWNEAFKREFLPEVSASGVEKWKVLPSGERVLHMSTSDLDVSEFTEYLNKLEAHAASELGVHFSTNPNEIEA